MKCPNCGSNLLSESYKHRGQMLFCLYCDNGDFGTDYTIPSKAVKEVESAYDWNGRKNDEQ